MNNIEELSNKFLTKQALEQLILEDIETIVGEVEVVK